MGLSIIQTLKYKNKLQISNLSYRFNSHSNNFSETIIFYHRIKKEITFAGNFIRKNHGNILVKSDKRNNICSSILFNKHDYHNKIHNLLNDWTT